MVLVGVLHVRWQMLNALALRPLCSKEVFFVFKEEQFLIDVVVRARLLQHCGLSFLRRVLI